MNKPAVPRNVIEGVLTLPDTKEMECVLRFINELRSKNSLLCSALEEISKTRYGIELSDSEEEQLVYWADLAMRYRRIASDALKTPQTPASDPQKGPRLSASTKGTGE
jgi:hypothetical protein